MRIKDIPKTAKGRKNAIQKLKKKMAKDKKVMIKLVEYSKIEEKRIRRGY